jgi:hypothetical protein
VLAARIQMKVDMVYVPCLLDYSGYGSNFIVNEIAGALPFVLYWKEAMETISCFPFLLMTRGPFEVNFV